MRKNLLSVVLVMCLSASTCMSVSAASSPVQTYTVFSVEDSSAEDELIAALDCISKLEVETVGSSLKAVKPTFKLLEWANSTTLSKEQFEGIMTERLSCLDNQAKETYLEQLGLINGTYEDLLSDSRDALLESAGILPEDVAWLNEVCTHADSLNIFELLMKAAGIE